jgi:hypothetical protein
MEKERDSFSVTGMLADLDGGTFESKLDYALRTTARAVRNHDSNKVKGEVTITFKVQRVGEGAQVMVDHKIGSKTPTTRGSKAEDDTTQTVMYVSSNGGLTVMPDTQGRLFGEKNAARDAEKHTAE